MSDVADKTGKQLCVLFVFLTKRTTCSKSKTQFCLYPVTVPIKSVTTVYTLFYP